MMKSLARAKFVAPILSELSTMNARSTGAHLHSADMQNTHINKIPKDHDSHGVWEIVIMKTSVFSAGLLQTHHNKLKREGKKSTNQCKSINNAEEKVHTSGLANQGLS